MTDAEAPAPMTAEVPQQNKGFPQQRAVSAREYYDLGLNIVVLNSLKEPLVKWTQWETQRQTLEEFEALPFDRADLYAIICGQKLTNGLYVGAIDVDVKKVSEEAIQRGKEFEKRLRITQTEQTPSGGKHYIFYSKQPIQSNNKAHEYCGVEVLGEKKLCIMAPSKGYTRLNDNTPTEIEDLNATFENILTAIGFKTGINFQETAPTGAPLLVRPCIVELIKKPHMDHMERVAIVTEYAAANYTPIDIEKLFVSQDDYEPEKTKYQVNHILTNKYKRFWCSTLKSMTLCQQGCTWKPQPQTDFEDKEDKFNPVKFAKYLMRDTIFKTLRDTEEVYVYDPNLGIFKPNGATTIKESMANTLDEETRQRHYADVLFYIQAITYIDRPHNPLGNLAVENGILDVKTQELTPFNPEYFITSSLPITYDKQAQCPKILKFLTEVLGENQLPLIQEGFGYCLYKDMPFHKIFMLVGDGANGKSTLLELLKRFLGSENVSNVTLQGLCENRFSIAQLHNKMANISADLPSKKLWQTGTLKMLTGNDTVTAEEKFKQPFSFKNPAKLFFSTNKIPETTDDTPAFFRRWVLIVCNNVFVGEKCNPHIIEEITTKEEMSGLLNWSLEGLDRLLKNGRFSTTENLEDIRNEYIRKSNSAKAYIEENLVYENDPAAIIPANELYSNYVIYCQKQELPSMPKRSFTQNMEQWLPQAKNTTARINNKVIRVWQFVKIVTDVICLDMPIVTDVTEVLPKREKSLFLEGQSVTNKEKVVTDGEVKKNGKVCLSGASVTSVTKCHNCGVELNGVIGRDKEGRPLCLTCERAFRIEGSE